MAGCDESVKVSRAAIILNARKPGAAAERARDALEAQGIAVELCATESAQAGAQAAEQAIARGARWIVAAGGDGTVMSVLEPVVRAGVALSLLPLGTANDFATYLALGGMASALDALTSGVVVALDVSECEYAQPDGTRGLGLFTSSAGVGVMGRLAELEDTQTATVLKRSLGNAVWPLLATAATLTAPMARARIVCDGKAMERSIAALEVSKLPRVGGIEVTPDAGGDSGILHVWVAEGERRGELVHTLRCALRGSGQLLTSRHVQYVSRDPGTNALGVSHVTELRLETTPSLPLHLNGDYVGRTPAHFKVREAALRVRVPKTHPLASGNRRSVPNSAAAGQSDARPLRI
jgi:diacylglycerol kinase (ATP)